MLHELAQLSSFDHPQPLLAASATAIGNFDGAHCGHQALLARLVQARPLPRVVLTFTPHPEEFFRRRKDPTNTAPANLFTPAQKHRALAELGVDYLLDQTFSEAFSQLSPEAFYRSILQEALGARTVVVGENFYFAHHRQGTAAWLQQRMGNDHKQLWVVPAAEYRGAAISSTRIRSALRQGEIELANALLGRPYLLEGSSVPGLQLGRRLGVPTINLSLPAQLLPADGVYAGYVWLAPESSRSSSTPSAVPPIFPNLKQLIPAVFNLGLRPSIKSATAHRHCEAHLLTGHYGDNLYELTCGFYLRFFLRAETTFASFAQLQNQIVQDIVCARLKLQL